MQCFRKRWYKSAGGWRVRGTDRAENAQKSGFRCKVEDDKVRETTRWLSSSACFCRAYRNQYVIKSTLANWWSRYGLRPLDHRGNKTLWQSSIPFTALHSQCNSSHRWTATSRNISNCAMTSDLL